jgi:hypothetical protein
MSERRPAHGVSPHVFDARTHPPTHGVLASRSARAEFLPFRLAGLAWLLPSPFTRGVGDGPVVAKEKQQQQQVVSAKTYVDNPTLRKFPCQFRFHRLPPAPEKHAQYNLGSGCHVPAMGPILSPRDSGELIAASPAVHYGNTRTQYNLETHVLFLTRPDSGADEIQAHAEPVVLCSR